MTSYIKPDWPAPQHIHAYTTLRTGFSVEKSPNHVTENHVLTTLFSLPETPIWINQTHSNIAIRADDASLDCEADASYTATSNRVCVVLTADCLPVLLTSKDGKEVAAIHAGWRGLASGIIENTIANMQTPGDQLLAWLGPAIGPNRFEVGQDVYDAFTKNDVAAQQSFARLNADKWLANLYQLATRRLNKLGVTQVYGGEYCTHTQSELFFSYRREKGTKGRMASVIWISG